jgi:hypothetical protein
LTFGLRNLGCVVLCGAIGACAAVKKPEVLECLDWEDKGDHQQALQACQRAALRHGESDVGRAIAARLPVLIRLVEVKQEIDLVRQSNAAAKAEVKLRRQLRKLQRERESN